MTKKLCIIFLLLASPVLAQVDTIKKTSKKPVKTLDIKTVKPFLYFKIAEKSNQKGKAVVLYAKSDLLNYAFIDTGGKVEFSYPIETDEETPGFIFDTTKNDLSVSFSNKSANYRVYEVQKKIGVEATIGGILYEQIGVISSKKGSLRDLLKAKLDNVIIR
jgi:hypothetical protein